MENSGSSKVMSVISLALAIVAVIVALAMGARETPPAPTGAGSEGRIQELDSQLTDIRNRLAALEATPKAPAAGGDVDKAKFVTMDAVLRDQEALLAELRAKVAKLESAKPAAQPAASAATEGRVVRAQRVEIVSASGRVRGVIEVGENGAPALSFLDDDGRVRSEYLLTPSGNARLFFSERDGKRYSLLPIVTESR